MKSSYDVVDVHVSSLKSRLDSVLEHPLLDGQKKYTLQVTEFSMPLSLEGPLPANENFSEPADVAPRMLLLQVRAKLIGQQPGANATLLSNVPLIGGQFGPVPPSTNSRERFVPTSIRPMRTPNDLVYYLQRYFDDIKAVYSPGGITGNSHGGAPNETVGDQDVFASVDLTPSGMLRFYFGAKFCKHFFLTTSLYGRTILGLEAPDDLIAFRKVGDVMHTGLDALQDGGAVIVAGATNETVIFQSTYSLFRNFDHRTRIELQTDMQIPNSVVWNTDNKQRNSKVIATFPINMQYESGLVLNTEGGNNGQTTMVSNLFAGDLIWRRAEDKISERYEILNSQFFQNIRLDVYIVRKEWVVNKFVFKRREVVLADGDSWTAKLRFKTL